MNKTGWKKKKAEALELVRALEKQGIDSIKLKFAIARYEFYKRKVRD
jgi:hypothetical protein